MKHNEVKIKRYKITLTLWRKNGNVQTYNTTKIRRFYALVEADKFSKAYVKVAYGKTFDKYDHLVTFYNDGIYYNKIDVRYAIKAFLE